jgi:hypothetical protein
MRDDLAPAFRKSTYSNDQGACVEVADLANGYAVRDSKLGAASPILRLPRDQWAAFIAELKH